MEPTGAVVPIKKILKGLLINGIKPKAKYRFQVGITWATI
jgi:hypothetical protein